MCLEPIALLGFDLYQAEGKRAVVLLLDGEEVGPTSLGDPPAVAGHLVIECALGLVLGSASGLEKLQAVRLRLSANTSGARPCVLSCSTRSESSACVS